MKIISVYLFLAIGIFLQGCAGVSANTATAEPDYDVGKVAAIEGYALRNNMKVIWVNYPPARKK